MPVFLKTATAALILALGFGFASDFPVTVTDDRPSEVTIETAPQKIITLANFATDMAAALGIEPSDMTTYSGARNLVRLNQSGDPENAFVIVESEQLLQWDPEVLFLFASHGGNIKYSPLFDRLQAVKNQRAYSIGYQYSQSGGPIAREMVLREAAHLIYPDSFPVPDMPENARVTPLQFDK